jgi:hypothetical protein
MSVIKSFRLFGSSEKGEKLVAANLTWSVARAMPNVEEALVQIS